MSAKTFVDTNVFAYAYDGSEPQKQLAAREALAALDPNCIVISSQVLSEFYVVVTRKFSPPLSLEDAASALRDLACLSVVSVDSTMVLEAVEIQKRWQTSYWDGLIIAAAVSAGCTQILSEDLASGSTIAGVTIANPF